MQISGARVFQARGAANAKALRWEHACYIQRTAIEGQCGWNGEGAGMVRGGREVTSGQIMLGLMNHFIQSETRNPRNLERRSVMI